MLTAETQEKHLLFLYFDLLYNFFWTFFPLPPIPVVVVNFINTIKSISTFEVFFNHTFYLCYKLLPLCWPFAVL